jgi:hypothetical protein
MKENYEQSLFQWNKQPLKICAAIPFWHHRGTCDRAVTDGILGTEITSLIYNNPSSFNPIHLKNTFLVTKLEIFAEKNKNIIPKLSIFLRETLYILDLIHFIYFVINCLKVLRSFWLH